MWTRRNFLKGGLAAAEACARKPTRSLPDWKCPSIFPSGHLQSVDLENAHLFPIRRDGPGRTLTVQAQSTADLRSCDSAPTQQPAVILAKFPSHTIPGAVEADRSSALVDWEDSLQENLMN